MQHQPDFVAVIVLERFEGVFSAMTSYAHQRAESTPGHVSGQACLLSVWERLKPLVDVERVVIGPVDV